MSELTSRSNYTGATANFDDMINRFGVVTVMNAKVYTGSLPELCEVSDWNSVRKLKAHDIAAKLVTKKAELIDTLKIANITEEGPTKTVTGGQYSNPLIKFGKTATIEMQDALGDVRVLEALGAGIVETFDTPMGGGKHKVFHVTNTFSGPVTIMGDSFFIDQKTGAQVPVRILLYQVLPDSLFNLTQDAEGDATVFDLNGSLLSTDITIGTEGTQAGDKIVGVFYSILPGDGQNGYTISYVPATGEEQKVDTLVLAELNKNYGVTNPDGSYNVPVLAEYAIYSDKAASELVQEGKPVTVAKDTTYYVKKQA